MIKKNILLLVFIIISISGYSQYINYNLVNNRTFYSDSSKKNFNENNFLILNESTKFIDSTVKKVTISLNFGAIAILEKDKFKHVLQIGLSGSYKFYKKLHFNFNYLFLNNNYVSNVNEIVNNSSVLPGVGLLSKNKYNTHYTDFSLRYIPNKIFKINIGRSKFFIGDGFRSLILSDNASPMYNISLKTVFKKLTYTNLYLFLKDNNRSNDSVKNIKWKFSTMHLLTYTPTKWFSASVFEAVMFRSRSNNVNNVKYDLSYLNPVIFLRPVEYSLGSSDNVLIGALLKFTIAKKISLYGQLLLDEFLLSELRNNKGWWGNKYGIQAGLKYKHAFNIKHLNLLGEINYVRPFTYAHSEVLNNYSLLQQSLAHPKGSNFAELLFLAMYTLKKGQISFKTVYNYNGNNVNNINYGSNINLSYTSRNSEYGVTNIQGNIAKNTFVDLQYIGSLTKKFPFKFFGGLNIASYNKNGSNKFVPIIYIGLNSAMFNTYNDF